MGAKSQPRSQSLTGVDGQLTERALRALLKHHESSSEGKEQLLGNDLDVQVQFSLARIPGTASPKPIRIDIPHPLAKAASSGEEMDVDDNLQDVEACIIVKEESKPWVQEMIAQFPEQLGCIKKVLGLQSLRTKHKSFAQKRVLLDRFDVFFADDRILPMLSKAIGGKFFEKKKQPTPVKLSRKEALPFAVQKCLSSTFMYLSAGTCVTVKAGNTAMPPSKLIANIQSICSNVPSNVPRKWSNIGSISIKTSASVALPIYNKTPEELEQIMKLAKDEKQIIAQKGNNENENVDEGKKKRKIAAASTPLAKALKKQKAAEAKVEEEVASEKVEEKAKRSNKKKKKNDEPEKEMAAAATKTPKSSKKKKTDEPEKEMAAVATKTPKSSKKKKNAGPKEETAAAATKTPKSSKKKGNESIDIKQEEVKESKAPKSSKKKRKELVDSTVEEEATKEQKTPKSSKKQRKGKATEDDKITTSSASSKKKTPKKSSGAPAKDDNFIPSKKFDGGKKGYVFKKSKLGTGYYKDVLPVVDKSWLENLGKKSGGGRGGGSRKSMGQVKKKKGGRSRRSF